MLTETDYFTFRTEAKNGGGTLPVFCVALDNKTETHKINQEVKKGWVSNYDSFTALN